jgi:hypothetical protein
MLKLLLVLAALAGSGALAHAQTTGIPRTTGGRPDFQGVWQSRWLTPFERLDGTKEPTVTGDAAAAYAAARLADLYKNSPLHPDDDFDFAGLLPTEDGAFRTSLIVEPADGKRPQTQLAKDVGAASREIRKLAENPEGLSNDERCMSAAGRAPLGLTPGGMYRQIVQTPGHFVIYTEDQMSVRVVGIDAAARPAGLVSLAGDSVATWDGDTLVVVTTNIRPQLAPLGTPAFDQQRRVTERFTFNSANEISYGYVLEDSAMLSAPMSVHYLLTRTDHGMYEYACHEGNYSIGNMLLGARIVDGRQAVKPKP